MLKKLLQQYKTNQRLNQVVRLFSVNLIGIPIAIITSIVVTRYLGPQGYGDYRFILSIFNVGIIIFTFGFFQAGNRALVLNNDSQKAKEYYGAELAITGGLFIIMSLFLLFYAFFDPNIQQKNLGKALLFIIPFGWVFLLLQYFETLFQADNRINLLAMSRLFPKVGFLITAALVFFVFMHLEINRLAVIWFFYLATQIIVYLYILYKVHVSFANIKNRLLEIWAFNKSFGFNVYLGSLFAVGFAGLTEIFISYFGADNSGVGFYALALALCMPLSFIPNTIATTHYKDFSVSNKIPRKLLLITLGLSLAALIVLWVVVGPFVKFFYGKAFASVITLTFIISIGVTAYGLADFFNRFLGANGLGKALRNSSFIVGCSTLAFSLLFIPKWGEAGAAYAKLITGFIYFIIMLWYYYKYLNERITNENE